ncbi:hypothetical protein FOCC_FOCC007039 [Frankliniella occidentalis]|uniref:Zinc finger protein 143 n=1 Tax=Frankliniella occidentalis TaxID=133901 RepID=A0A9C6WYZ4_FRAOC|nr:zinc finger protein 143-like [Frankliniella occidentalis]KAE8746167.1 hypothetical protein FOCC_FOCC007039 [Frankliniella occidentalis]
MDNLEETSLISEGDNAACFVVGDGLGALDGNALFLQSGQSVQLEDGSTAFISEDGSLQQIELENGAATFVTLNTEIDSETPSSFLKVECDSDLKEDTSFKKRLLTDRKPDISISDSADLGYTLDLEDDQGTTFSILHFEESNDAQDPGSVKRSLLDEDDLSRSSLGDCAPIRSVLIDPDEPIVVGDDMNDENCHDNENEFFNNHEDDDDGDNMIEDPDEDDFPNLRLKVINPSRRKHVRTGRTKIYSCSVPGCSKTYTALHHLKVHARTHTGDRPFLCTEPSCDKRFGTNYALKAHIRTHTGEKPYICPEESCSKGFKTSGDLQKHIRTHTGERPFKCNVPGCDRSFTTSNIRKVHVRTHTGERPYECTEPGCGRAFASATNFKNHMRIHSGEKPYVCTVKLCGRRFTEYSSLYKHQTVHTQQKPYECKDCGRNYRQSSTLTMHRRTAHGIIQTTDGTEIMLQFPPIAPDKIESYMFLELSEENSTLVQFNSNQILESIESSTPSPALPVRAEDDSEDEDAVIRPSISIDDDDSSLKQIFVVTDDADITAYDESFDPLDSTVV